MYRGVEVEEGMTRAVDVVVLRNITHVRRAGKEGSFI